MLLEKVSEVLYGVEMVYYQLQPVTTRHPFGRGFIRAFFTLLIVAALLFYEIRPVRKKFLDDLKMLLDCTAPDHRPKGISNLCDQIELGDDLLQINWFTS